VRAQVGDWLVVKGVAVDTPEQRGLIIEVHSADGAPPYVVRWTRDNHVSTVFPGSDALVVTAAEQAAEDERHRGQAPGGEPSVTGARAPGNEAGQADAGR
jgi:hypothetical protein